MLRAFDQPAGIMLTKQERQSVDMDKEEEVLLSLLIWCDVNKILPVCAL